MFISSLQDRFLVGSFQHMSGLQYLLEKVLDDPLLRHVRADGEPILQLSLNLAHFLLVPL